MRFALPAALAAFAALLPFTGPQGSLREDTRVGVVTDRQGTALVRPVGRERWSPLGPKSLLLPGDQVRTPVRGANAVEILLRGGGTLVLGPGGLIELQQRAVRLYTGELEIQGSSERPVQVSGPGDFEQSATGTLVLRAKGKATERLGKPPRWLTGYRASTTDEWMGSLIASVDGRNVPLTVGYHKVVADIRDQIARTTVEQSFKNTTNATLEGVFYFPLPADASISGFGMWIGSELVEADIVEKQKARRIYEDILRRKKDPGLLEWSGGNLFKARVFPILPHSEKRIRIRYTQVLPLEGSKLRYRYALRSELLRTHPLRELALKINVSSTMPIKDVSSPTHEVRVRKTATAASAEFDAQEYTPAQDFELQIDVDQRRALTVVPHRRAADGYFMLLLAPPDDTQAGVFERELVPERGPLDLIVLADTSGSIDPPARAAQAAFVHGLLSQLGAKDRFRLATCDIDVHWFRPDRSSVTPSEIEAALGFLDGRASLGWTDLDRAFDELARHVGAETIVVYVGDGIGTTGDADPVALAQRLGARGEHGPGTFHAVSTSSTFERGVLEAIASLGGGSVRSIGDDPAATAFRLLKEAAQPAIKNLRVRFEGLRTARVYPATLPNLAPGTQQVVLGRFLPTGGEQRGRVLVTGTREGKEVRFAADIVLREGEAGNSFLPRLWARRHIDALLQEGRSPSIRDEVVSFSEEFGIMTPFTSFLVLESDEDRERYGVTRRVRMRDGEAFFAAGRDRATTELLREQMTLARTWRLNLRRRMLRELAGLGRELHVAVGATERAGKLGYIRDFDVQLAQGAARAPSGPTSPGPLERGGEWGDRRLDAKGKRLDLPATELEAAAERIEEEELALDKDAGDELDDVDEGRFFQPPADEFNGAPARKPALRPGSGFASNLSLGGGEMLARRSASYGLGSGRWAAPPGFARYRFPPLPDAPKPPKDLPDPAWPAEALRLLRALDRRDALAALTGGLEFRGRRESLHPLAGERTGYSLARGLYGAAGWLVRTLPGTNEPIDQWLAEGKRGALARGVGLGRRRDARPGDRMAWNYPMLDWYRRDLVRAYRKHTATIATEGDHAVVTLRAPAPSKQVVVLRFDAAKNVVLEREIREEDEVRSTTKCEALVERGGMWWPTRILHFDGENRLTNRLSLEITAFEADAFAARLKEALTGHDTAIFVGARDPELAAAKQAVFEKRGDFADHFKIAIHYAASGQWAKVFEAWTEAEKKVTGKPGAFWLRAHWNSVSRRGPDLREQLTARAPELAAGTDPAAAWRAGYAAQLAASRLDANERLRLLDTLQPVFSRQRTLAAEWTLWYQRSRASLLQVTGSREEARRIWQRLAVERPWDIAAVTQWMSALENAQRASEAIAYADRAVREQKWLDHEANRIFQRWTQLLWSERDLDALLATCERWVAREPRTDEGWMRWLSTLLFQNRLRQVDDWIRARLSEKLPDSFPHLVKAPRAKLSAAIRCAMGQGWNFQGNRIDERWWRPLADIARRLMRGEHAHTGLAAMIMNDWRFRRTDEYAALKKDLVRDLTEEGAIESMSVARLGQYVHQLDWGKTQVDPALWRAVTDRILARWRTVRQAESRRHERAALAGYVLRLLDAHGEKKQALAFQRERLQVTGDDARSQIAADLMRRLYGENWTEALEQELFALVPLLQPKELAILDEEGYRKLIAANAVRQLAERLYGMRYRALLGEPKDYEKLPRSELKHKKREARAAARRALAASFAAQRERATARAKPWLELERLCFAVRLGEDLKATAGEALELFASAPQERRQLADRILRERCAIVAAHATARRDATEELGDQVSSFLQGQIPATRDDTPKVAAVLDERVAPIDWRYHVFRHLVALGRVEPVAGLLASWIVPAKAESRWRVALGYLQAELGQLDDAIATFEGTSRLDELGPQEYEALANWLLVKGDEARRQKALLNRWRVTPENQLSSRLHAERRRVARRGEGVPPELDPAVFRITRALLEKARWPQNHVWQIRDIYRTTKDFRLLESVPFGVIGHTRQRIYPFLQNVGRVIGQIHEEATCDSLVRTIGQLMPRAERATDRRALLLLSAFVERRAAEVRNQPGPHAERGLAALRQAFREEWAKGEPVQMSNLLASLGKIPQRPFADEQLRQLRVLFERAPPGANDRLQAGYNLARTRWGYGAHDEAIDQLTQVLDERRRARGTLDAFSQFRTLVGWLRHRRRFALAERHVLRELDAQQAAARPQYRDLLFQVHVDALQNRGAVSLGRGERLYTAARKRMTDSMFEHEKNRVRYTLQHFCRLHEAACKVGIDTAGGDLELFAKNKLPELLTFLPGNASRLVNPVANSLRKIQGPLSALGFLIERIEQEPAWWARIGQDGWRHYAWSLGKWRGEAPALGDLEERLLRIVLAELERDLVSTQSRYRVIYTSGSLFWAAKRADFGRVAQKVIELHPDSPARQLWAAEYLWSGLRMKRRAADALLAAEKRGMLRENGRLRLVEMLHDGSVRRFQESLPVLDALVGARPDRLVYRTLKIRALHEVGRDPEAVALLDATVKRFKEQKRWNEATVAALARVSRSSEFFERATAFYDEAIGLHQRTHRNRGIGGGTLSAYYGEAAECWARLGKADQSVDMASAAVIAWGRTHRNRNEALQKLQNVIRRIRDLDAFVARRDEKVRASGLDAPLIRKMIGKVYLTRRESKKSIPQLVAARDLQPADDEIHRLLLQAHDNLGDKQAACAALRASIRSAPMNLGLYPELGKRLTELGDENAAERAWTTLAEVRPNESEPHRLLACHREEQKRFGDAALQWRQVVRCRPEDPAGWLALAKAHLQAGDKKAARTTIDHLLETKWEERFGDLKTRAGELLRQLSGPPK